MRRRSTTMRVFDGVPFFEGCNPRRLAEVTHHADRVRVPAGTVLARAGRPARELLVLTEGVARAVDGTGAHTLTAGQAIAPEAVTAHRPFPMTVTAVDDVEVLVVNGPAFRLAVREFPALAYRIAGPGPLVAA